MPVMLERWNDDKMDALDTKVDGLDHRMKKGFERVDTEMRELRQDMKAGFERVDGRFGDIDGRFERLNHVLIGAAAAIIAAVIGAAAAIFIALINTPHV
jgi:hypothetical protein